MALKPVKPHPPTGGGATRRVAPRRDHRRRLMGPAARARPIFVKRSHLAGRWRKLDATQKPSISEWAFMSVHERPRWLGAEIHRRSSGAHHNPDGTDAS
jgi:hypothetical protein